MEFALVLFLGYVGVSAIIVISYAIGAWVGYKVLGPLLFGEWFDRWLEKKLDEEYGKAEK